MLNLTNVEKEIKKEISPGLSSKSGFTQTCPAPTREPPAQRDHREQKREGLGGSGCGALVVLLHTMGQLSHSPSASHVQ